jgi:hypothetical protein
MARSISGDDGPGSDSVPKKALVLVLPGENVGIVVISEALLRRVSATNARKRTVLVATSVRGRQFRMMLGYWPAARSVAVGSRRRREGFRYVLGSIPGFDMSCCNFTG